MRILYWGLILCLSFNLSGCSFFQSSDIITFAYPNEVINPASVAVDGYGNVFVLDLSSANGVIKKYDSSGVFLKSFASLGVEKGELQTPFRLEFAENSNLLYVTDPGGIGGEKRKRRVLKYDGQGKYLGDLISYQVNQAEKDYYGPTGIAYYNDLIYLTNVDRFEGVNAHGKVMQASLGRRDRFFGYYLSDYIYGPEGIALDSQGRIYILDTYSGLIRVFSSAESLLHNIEIPRRVRVTEPLKGQIRIYHDFLYFLDTEKKVIYELDLQGQKRRIIGRGILEKAVDFCFDQAGRFYIADQGAHCILVLSHAGQLMQHIGKLPAQNFFLSNPRAVAVDKKGNIYIASQKKIIKILPKLKKSEILFADLDEPTGVSLDRQENIYITDRNHKRKRKFAANGNLLNTINIKGDLALDKKGNVYLGNSSYVVKLKPDFTEEWRSASNRQLALYNQGALAVGEDGKIYMLDQILNQVKCFSRDGKLLFNFAGAGSGLGELSNPKGIAVDKKGNVVIADTGNNCLDFFDAKGNFLKRIGQFGNGEMEFNSPEGVAVDRQGKIYVADTGNNRIVVFKLDV